MATDQTARYRATSRAQYARALAALVAYARDHPDPDFLAGPLQLEAMEQEGLVVSGPDLSGVAAMLDGIPGLVQVPA